MHMDPSICILLLKSQQSLRDILLFSNLRFGLPAQPFEQGGASPSPKQIQHFFTHPLLSRQGQSPLQIRKSIRLYKDTSTIACFPLVEEPTYGQSNGLRFIDWHAQFCHFLGINVWMSSHAAIVSCQNGCDCYSRRNDRYSNVDFCALLFQRSHESNDACFERLLISLQSKYQEKSCISYRV
jgi:hypothetical protein